MNRKHDVFWLNLATPFREKFGDGYMQMRTIIHHLYGCVYRQREFNIAELVKKTGLDENRIMEIVMWLNEQEVFDFKIDWR